MCGFDTKISFSLNKSQHYASSRIQLKSFATTVLWMNFHSKSSCDIDMSMSNLNLEMKTVAKDTKKKKEKSKVVAKG